MRHDARLRDDCSPAILFRSHRAVLEAWRADYKRASHHPSVYVIEENCFAHLDAIRRGALGSGERVQ
jgi:hypothetical protein